MLEEKEILDLSMKESFRQRDERIEKAKKTYSEEMQDKIEPIDNDYVNKILKGSGWWKNHIQNKASVTGIIFLK